jgi:integrase
MVMTAKKRKPKGQGSVYFSKAKKLWTVKIPVMNPLTGKMEPTYHYAKNALDAELLKRRLLDERDNNTLVLGPRCSFRDYAMRFLEFRAPKKCKATTVDFYYQILNMYVFPVFGERTFRDITPGEIQDFLTALDKKERYADKTIETIRGVMMSVYTSAEKLGEISSNPMKRTSPPEKDPYKPKKRHPVWSESEQREVIADSINSPFETYLFLMLTTGLRLGEATGLRWEDIDDTPGGVWIQRTLRQTTPFPVDGVKRKSHLVFNTPKSPDSHRYLQLQPVVLDSLQRHKLEQDLIRSEKGPDWNPKGLVFPNYDGTPVAPSTFRSRYKRFLESIGVRYIAPHDIRHTFAMTLIENKASVKQVQQALGHSTSKVTEEYYIKDVPKLGHEAVAMQTKFLFPDSPANEIIGENAPKPSEGGIRTPRKSSRNFRDN